MSFIPVHSIVRWADNRNAKHYTHIQVTKVNDSTFDGIIVKSPNDNEGDVMLKQPISNYEVVSWSPDKRMPIVESNVPATPSSQNFTSPLSNEALLALGLI